MIIVHINPAGIEKIIFANDSDLMEDLSMAVWPIVRPELNRLDRKLKKTARSALKGDVAANNRRDQK